MSKSYGQIIVQSERGEKLKLTFTSRKVFDEARWALIKAKANVTDETWGYKVCASADAALKEVAFWLQ